jgi:FAD/FMN-containing dehydrogenase
MTGVLEQLAAAGLQASPLGPGLRVVLRSESELQRALAACALLKLRARARGEGDALREPPAGSALLDLAPINRIGRPDPVSLTVRAEAGARVLDVEDAAQREGLTLGPLLPGARAGSVGAWLAGPTRGNRAIPGGRLETAALTVRGMLADGTPVETRAAPRSATGPDLDHVTLGAAGLTTVVAAATLRLFPRPSAFDRATARVADPGPALARVVRAGLDPWQARIEGNRVEVLFAGPRAGVRARDARRLMGGEDAAGPETGHGPWLELDVPWEAAAPALAAVGISVDSLRAEILALHAGGCCAAIALDRQDGRVAAEAARHAGARVIGPSAYRKTEAPWAAAGAGAVWTRLTDALDPAGVLR